MLRKLHQVSAISHPRSSAFNSIPKYHPAFVSDFSPVLPRWDSYICSIFPPLFDDLKFIRLLYRGSRDGFSAIAFHRRCDFQGPTLTLIRSSTGAVFGGYSAVDWDSKSEHKLDDTRTSFLFTLKNPHDTSPMRFPLKGDGGNAILCLPRYGPSFGGAPGHPADLCVRDKFDEQGTGRGGHTCQFGSTYENSTGLPGSTVFTGAAEFHVSEIEVFEISE
jgi:hypothetical protein